MGLEKEEYFKSEYDTVYKTVGHEDGGMSYFLFQHGTNKWVPSTIGFLAQVQWNGEQIDKAEAERQIASQLSADEAVAR